VFEESTEDGMCFRIYRLGNLEVRSIQELDAAEVILVVYAIILEPLNVEEADEALPETARLSKVTEYVEGAFMPGNGRLTLDWHYYVVMEVAQGRKILAECLNDGSTRWIEDPRFVNHRISLSKVFRTSKSWNGITVGDMKAFCSPARTEDRLVASAMQTNYAHTAFARGVKMLPVPAWLRRRAQPSETAQLGCEH